MVMRAKVTYLFICLVLGASAGGCSGSPPNCSPCPPGTVAGNPSVPCSACIPVDGDVDGAGG